MHGSDSVKSDREYNVLVLHIFSKMIPSLLHLINYPTLYSNATSPVFVNGKKGERFHTSVGVHQGCLISSTLFNIFLEKNN